MSIFFLFLCQVSNWNALAWVWKNSSEKTLFSGTVKNSNNNGKSYVY